MSMIPNIITTIMWCGHLPSRQDIIIRRLRLPKHLRP
jgi:hypothetical protein